MGLNIAVELQYEVLPRKHRNALCGVLIVTMIWLNLIVGAQICLVFADPKASPESTRVRHRFAISYTVL
jgi:hypothetical protein